MQTQTQDKEIRNLEKRFTELSRTAYQREIVTYTDFLNLNEQNILHTLPKDMLYTRFISFGGYETAERQITAFIPEALYLRWGKNVILPADLDYPFCAVRICPLNERFSETLTHRDYLGAVLNLGVERSRTGDIIPVGKEALIFVHNDIADFMLHELTRIRHTSVKTQRVELGNMDYSPKYEELHGTVASVRLDSLLTLAFTGSRSKLSGLIEGARVYVNGRLITSNRYQPEEGDIISVRGLGKFRYDGCGGRSRKNRLTVTVSKYI